MSREAVPLNATYFREYGMHPVKQQDGEDYIASFPNWEETLQALKSGLPDKGNVITPEYTAAPDDITDLNQHTQLIDDRIHAAMDVTRRSDATLHLGTPTYELNPYGRPKWLNSVLSIHRGKVAAVTHKTALVPAEIKFGISRPDREQRMIKDGNAVLICAELFELFFSDEKSGALHSKNVRQIFASTAWAMPQGESLTKFHEEAGGEDNYYRQQLEKVIGSYLLRKMPAVNRVIVSDRGRQDIAPYNAVFDRID